MYEPFLDQLESARPGTCTGKTAHSTMRTHSQASQGLQLQDINTSFLDSLVLDFLSAEDFVEEEDAEAQEKLLQRLAAHAAYQQLQQGSVSNAIALAARYCPAVLEDQRLSFRLKRQQFIELLRQETPEADSAALACAREELAPLALHAYPEAFLDFKKTLLMLVDTQQQLRPQQQQQQQQQQNKQEWSLEARQQLAETLYHSMLLQMGCQAPSLAQLLRYLLHLYQQYSSAAASGGGGGSSRGVSRASQQQLQQQAQALAASRGGKVSQGLLLEGRDEGPLPPDVSGQQMRATDVQALMAAVGLQRREAEDALKLTGGDVRAALGHQLGRLRLSTPPLDCLVWEYATARGLVEPADGPEAVAAAIAAAAAAHLSVTDDAMDVDTAAVLQQQQPRSPQLPAAGAAAGGSGAVPADSGSSGGGDMPPPANRSVKRSKASISNSSSSSSQPVGSTHSPFRSQQQQQQQGAGAPEGLSPLLSVPSHGPASALNRSASQSPPYKAPRYRRKQTPSRFYCPAAEEGTPAATASSQQQQQQQRQQLWGSQLEEVVVMGGGSSGGGSTEQQQPQLPHAATQPPAVTADGPAVTLKGSPVKAQQQQQQSDSTPKAQLNSSGSAGAASPGDTVQQLVTQARAAMQQQRWQQLQQQLKGQSLAGGGALAEQLEAQEQVAQVQVLLQKQQYAEAEQLLDKLAPGLLQEQHRALFELKRCQFTLLVEAGELPAALQLARSQLTPLADKHPELLPCLKSSMSLLLPGPAAGGSSGSSGSSSTELGSKLWDVLLPLLQAKLGIQPPQLVSLLQVLLTAHKAWFVRHRCSDPFAGALQITQLQAATTAGQAPPPPPAAAAGERPPSASRGAEAAAGAGGIAARLAAGAASAAALDWEFLSGSNDVYGLEAAAAGPEHHMDDMMEEEEDEEEEEGAEVDEAAVLQVMEVLELPRGTALELLAEHGGDAQAVILSVLGG